MPQKKPQVGKPVSFEVYRYQLLVDKAVQLRIDSPYQSLEAVRAAKNDLFQALLTNQRFQFQAGKSAITSKMLYSDGVRTYFRIGVERQLKISLKDFSEDYVENYPNIIVAINNDPTVQLIAIQDNTKAFQETSIVSNFLRDTFDRELRKDSLSFYLDPLFDKKEFWKLVETYQGRINQLTFDMISPNMSNKSEGLKVDLRQFYEDTNSHKTTVELNSDKDSNLEINPESGLIQSLVDYTSEGCGNISIKVNGMRKKLHTAQSKKDFSIEEHLIKNNDWEALNKAFKEINL
jgi:hypothetical protein